MIPTEGAMGKSMALFRWEVALTPRALQRRMGSSYAELL